MNIIGVHRTANLKKLGMHSSDTAEIFFDNVRVPACHIIGEEGQGFFYQMLQFQDERLVAAAVLLEPIQRCITLTAEYAGERKIFGSTVLNQQVPACHIIGEEGQGFFYQMLQFQDERLVAAAVLLEPIQRCITLTAEYAGERKIFGSTVLNQQTVHFTLAELQSELEAVRSLLYRAVLSRIHGEDVTLLASMVKLKAGRLARIVTDSCLQFWGGNGFTWDNPICRMHRDLRLHSVGAGADEVMLSIICKQMGIAPAKRQ
ncbi:acyl-CoA dehydrogenase protein [Dictyocaulus viviparus]|uniref:Acyl-CoA dehydrogenase protein n=1 Tax=Dictyocaulus viviparus TaxID=29172 RepID=A0A0D8XFM5_DICVI|nr:acyl-CoA dehydrogenase protein [Dictyocaulus viviparus]